MDVGESQPESDGGSEWENNSESDRESDDERDPKGKQKRKQGSSLKENKAAQKKARIEASQEDPIEASEEDLEAPIQKFRVPFVIGDYTDDLEKGFMSRSAKERGNSVLRGMRKRAQYFVKYAPTFKAEFSRDNIPGKKDVKTITEHLADPSHPMVSHSAQWIDRDGEPLMFYLSARFLDDSAEKKCYPLSAQYDDRTSQFDKKRVVHDGLRLPSVQRCWEATQNLCAVLPPKKDKTSRHTVQRSDGGDNNLFQYQASDGSILQEPLGTLHLAQGWTATGHPHDHLYLSTDMTRSASGNTTVKCHYDATRVLAQQLKAIFEVLLPSHARTYQTAFEAGACLKDVDPGPFLARAIVWKMQLSPHVDKGDVGPSISFPFGHYEGGHLLVPQLNLKLNYQPGDLCIFWSSKLYHSLSEWRPLLPNPGMDAKHLTPGRGAMVFFLPQLSLKQLKGKKKDWGQNTSYGRVPDPSYC